MKCFTIFVQSSHIAYLMWGYRLLLFFLGIYFFYHFFCLHDFQILAKSRKDEGSTFSCLRIVCLLLTFDRSIYFIKCSVFYFLNLDGGILNLFIHISKFERNTKIQIQCFFFYFVFKLYLYFFFLLFVFFCIFFSKPLRDCQQITFVTLNRFYLLIELPPPPLPMDNIKKERIPKIA